MSLARLATLSCTLSSSSKFRTRHRQEQTFGQVQAHAFLQLVGLVLQAGHLLLYLFYLGPVFDHYGLEERHQVRRALMGLGDMLLHGADG